MNNYSLYCIKIPEDLYVGLDTNDPDYDIKSARRLTDWCKANPADHSFHPEIIPEVNKNAVSK